ncbi:MAG TPA: ATP-binding protein [Nitrospirales bacterium]|nr:ATP-binding protein [Nitrospirales bacterium]
MARDVTLDFVCHVFEAIQSPVFVKDQDFRFAFVNDAFCRIMRRGRHELIGFTDFDVAPPEQAQVFRDVDTMIIASAEPHENEEFLSTPDGTEFIVVTRKSVIELPGRGRFIVGVMSDITERKRMEAALSKAKAEAENANRAKSQFLANMSHELRTPLNAIIGFSEIIKEELLGQGAFARYKVYAADIHKSGRHLLDLINDILDLTKVEAGKYRLQESECDVAAIVAEVAHLMHDLAQRNGVALSQRLPADLPRLLGDARAIRQIVVNLLSNAIKFTPSGGRVTLAAGLASDGMLEIKVADTGIGMAPRDIPRALKPFLQLEDTWGRKYEGTGLGLPLVNALLTLHDGTLQIDSIPAVGTTVTARFPAARTIGG